MKKLIYLFIISIFLSFTVSADTPKEYIVAPRDNLTMPEVIQYLQSLSGTINRLQLDIYNKLGVTNSGDVTIQKIQKEITRVNNNTYINELGPFKFAHGEANVNGLKVRGEGTIFTGDGNYANTDTPFYVDIDSQFSLSDKLYFDGTNLWVVGNITADTLTAISSGNIAGFIITPSSLTSPGANIVLDSANKTITAGTIEINGDDTYIKDDSYVKDRSGVYISPEYSQFNNGSFLGELQSTVYKVNTVNGVGGKFIVSPGTNLALESGNRLTYDDNYITYGGSYLTYFSNEISVLSNVFSSNTVILIQTEVSGDTLTEYMLVTDTGTYVTVSTHTVSQGYYYTYAVDRNLDGSGKDRFPAGSGVISTGGPSDGYIIFDAQSSNNPFIHVLTRNTTTYNDVTITSGLGNLASITDTDFDDMTGEGIYTNKGRFKGDIVASTMNASNIIASTITAGSTSGAHTVIDTSGINSYDTTGSTKVFQVITSGTDVGDVIIGDYAQDVGIKWDSSGSSLTIKGAVDIVYKSAQARKMAIGGSIFDPATEALDYTIGGSGQYLVADDLTPTPFSKVVNFPNDATVTELTMYVESSTPTASIVFALRELYLDKNGGPATMASGTAISSTGTYSVSDSSINSPTIDNDNYMYCIDIIIDNVVAGQEIKLYSFKIDYTVTRPLP